MSRAENNALQSESVLEAAEPVAATVGQKGHLLPKERRSKSVSGGMIRLIAFFVLLVTLIVLIDRAVGDGMRRIQTSGFGVLNNVVNGQANADILISGSSRAWVHYDPRELKKATGLSAYNIGLNGSQSDMQLALLKVYLQHNRKPRLIIHNLDLYSLQTSREIYDVARYLPYLSEAPIYETIRTVYPEAWRWKVLPLYGHLVEDARFNWLTGLKAFVGIQPREDHINGFVPRHLEWTSDFGRFREHNPDGVRFEITTAGVRCIEEIAEICQRDQIPLLFVYSPEYRPMQELERNRKEIFDRFRDICARFDVPLWDYSDSDICLSREYFYNSQHLNAAGAARFSGELARRLAADLKLKN